MAVSLVSHIIIIFIISSNQEHLANSRGYQKLFTKERQMSNPNLMCTVYVH